MARMCFDKEGATFLDVLITTQSRGFGAIVQLRVPAALGRSGLLLRREFFIGRGPADLNKFIENMFAPENGSHPDLMITFRQASGEKMKFSANWKDRTGELSFQCLVSEPSVIRFRKKLEEIFLSLTARNTCRKR